MKVTSNFSPYGYLANVFVTNTSTAPITPPWTVTWRFGEGQSIQNVFSAGYYQVGPTITFTSPSFAGAIAPGAANSFGFIASGMASAPIDATFNGVSCPLTFS